MNELETIYQIKRENLDEKNYFESLVVSAYTKQILSEDDLSKLKAQIIQLLDERIYKYNGLESSSIRKEIMEEINASNYYTIGLQLKTFDNPDEAVKEIREKNIIDIYYEGRKRIDKILNIIRVMYLKVKQNKLITQNYTYNSTITGGIQGFLKIYNPDFKAQDMRITADYPLYNNLIGELEGVEFIKEYIYSIYLENEFCAKFSSEKIENLLYNYSGEYKDLIINIFEIVLFEAIACKLVKRKIYDLEISDFELNEIYSIFKKQDKEEIKKTVNEICIEICKELALKNKDIQKYIEKKLDTIVNMISNGLEQNRLDKIFIPSNLIEY